MNKKALALIIGGLVLLALIIYFIFFYNFNKQNQNTATNQTGQNVPAQPVISTPITPTKTATPATTQEQSRDAANQLGIYFAERYGTSSSQADFSNLTESEIFMTADFATRTEAFIASERKKLSTPQAYQSIVTKATIVNFSAFDDTAGTATGVVKTKRQTTAVDGKVTSKDQDLAISLKKVNNTWKVDSATWK